MKKKKKNNDNVVKAWRTANKFTQQEAAQALGMPYNTYRKKEEGVRPVNGVMMTAMRCVDLERKTKQA